MNDSNAPEHLDSKHERNHEQRIEGIKRWVEYIKSEPPETWGPQQNAVVNDQLDAVHSAQTPASHQQQEEESLYRRHVLTVAPRCSLNSTVTSADPRPSP